MPVALAAALLALALLRPGAPAEPDDRTAFERRALAIVVAPGTDVVRLEGAVLGRRGPALSAVGLLMIAVGGDWRRRRRGPRSRVGDVLTGRDGVFDRRVRRSGTDSVQSRERTPLETSPVMGAAR